MIDHGAAVDLDRRVLVVAPTKKDGAIARSLLADSGLPNLICHSVDALVVELRRGAAAILIAEELIDPAALAPLAELIAVQPPWSDIPVLILTPAGTESAAAAENVKMLGNVTLLERPIRVGTLMSAIRTAARARDRQYQIRGHLEERLRAEDALRAADRRKDEFLATLGHELRNPLAPIVAGLHLLKIDAVADARSLRACTVMERQLNHLVRLADDLLEVSRITRGVIEVHREPLELGAVLKAAIDMSHPLISAAQQELHVNVPREPITVAGDAVRLTQIFGNILNNASKYSNVGGHIWVTASVSPDGAVVSVRDHGIGIAASQLGNVFDLFTQVDRPRHRAQGGLGIGLTLVRTLVSMHGGSVEARSAGIEKGSEFIVRLPVLRSQPVARPDAAPRLPTFPARRILIVDDNRDAAEALGTLLHALGAIPSVAHTGDAALKLLETDDPQVVVLDLGMPGLDGFEIARRIRARALSHPVLLIALTGWGRDEDRTRVLEAGFDHHLVKPVDIDRLRQLVVAHARRRPR